MAVETDPKIYRTATLLIEEYGDFAPAGAFIKADQLSDAGDFKGCETWRRIAKVAEELLSDNPPRGATIH